MGDYLKYLALSIVLVLVCGGILIALGNLFNPYWAIGGFIVMIGFGIWYWNYDAKKTKCPKQK